MSSEIMDKTFILAVVTLACFHGIDATVPTVNGPHVTAIDEQAAVGTIAYAIVSDVNPMYCPISGDDAAFFTSVHGAIADAGNVCQFAVAVPPDAQTNPTLTFTAIATDAGNVADSSNVPITITVTNKSPLFPSLGYAVNLAENSGAGTTVETVTATPVTSGDTVAYAIGGGNTNSEFTIDSTSGLITIDTGKTVSSSTLKGYALVIHATTGTGTVYTGTVTVPIVVGLGTSGSGIHTGSGVLLGAAIFSMVLQML